MYSDKMLPLVKSAAEAKWKLAIHTAEDDDDVASDAGVVEWAKKSVLKGLNEAIQQYLEIKKEKNESKLVTLVSNLDADTRFKADFIVDNW